MALDIWTPAELIEIQQDERVAPPDGFWSGTGGFNGGDPTATLGVFNREVTFESSKIYFDELPIRDRRLAPFVAPNVQGQIMKEYGRSMASFSPAYVKPKHKVTPDRANARRPGESYNLTGGALSLEQRYDQIVAQNMSDERSMIERRWDWMASQAVIYGSVTISGENYPTVTVDFKRDPSLTYVLTGNARWDQLTTAAPLTDIKNGRRNAFQIGQSPVKKFIFGTMAWELFIMNQAVKDLLWTQSRGSTSVFTSISLSEDEPVEYKGFISGPDGGRIDMWVYSNIYTDPEDSQSYSYLDPRDVVGVGNAAQGVRCFGAIQDKRAGLIAMPMFPKMYDEEDPSCTYTLTQSAPLMVVGNPNNTFRIRVTDSAVD